MQGGILTQCQQAKAFTGGPTHQGDAPQGSLEEAVGLRTAIVGDAAAIQLLAKQMLLRGSISAGL